MPRLNGCAVPAFIIAALLINGGNRTLARKASSKTGVEANDQIEVIGHVAFDGTAVTQLTTAEHWRKNYLYLNSAQKITVIDVTNGARPVMMSEYHHALSADESQVQVIVGTAALLGDGPPKAPVPRSLSIMSFASPAEPQVVRQFTKVTGFLVDSHRRLIYVVNNEGLWILRENPGRDMELEEQYEHELRYNR